MQKRYPPLTLVYIHAGERDQPMDRVIECLRVPHRSGAHQYRIVLLAARVKMKSRIGCQIGLDRAVEHHVAIMRRVVELVLVLKRRHK